ncbi:unnamed protein product [Trifolium pratense]|uniref:Uncharacterized protein n=1 Tax=Trifolium pratense TaxID=57577 RepID=A0ACB0ILR6_TRIPR|nr:unnamed protein product [Trifolium pratense]
MRGVLPHQEGVSCVWCNCRLETSTHLFLQAKSGVLGEVYRFFFTFDHMNLKRGHRLTVIAKMACWPWPSKIFLPSLESVLVF